MKSTFVSPRRRRQTVVTGVAIAIGAFVGGGSAHAIPKQVNCPNQKCAMAYIKACDAAGGTYDNDGFKVWCVR